MTIIFCAVVFFAVGYSAAYVQARTARPRHRHDWEVVEKERIEGVDVEAARRLASEVDYMVSESDMRALVERTRGEHLVVHYRCMCGAEKVERV